MYHSRKTHARLQALLISALAITPVTVISQVVLVPGEINGTVRIGAEVIQSARITASNADDSASQNLSPNAVEVSYKLTVNVPSGETATYNVRPYPIYTRDSNLDSDLFGFPPASVDVNESGPSTQDFILDQPGHISGTVNLSGDGELRRIEVYATPQPANNYIHRTNQSASAEEKQSLSYEFPVSTGEMRCHGTAWLTSNARITLPSKDVTVVAGEAADCSYDIATPETGSIEGEIEFSGTVEPYRFQVNTNFYDPTNRNWSSAVDPNNPESYALEDLSAGKYRLRAYAYFNSNDDFYNFPISAYTPAYNPDLAAAEVVNVDIRACQAYLNGNFNLRGTITPDDVSGMNYRMIGRAEASGGWATDQVDKATGDYDLILSPGQWYSDYLYIVLSRPATDEDGYLSTYFYIYDNSVYPSSDPLTLADCGETAADTDYEYQFGKVTVNFSIEKVGATMSSPHLRAYNCRENDDQEVLLYRYSNFYAGSLQQNVEQGSVTFLAPQAVCTDMEAFATVDGSVTSFGKFELEVVGGSDVIIDIGGPSINVTAPAAEECVAGDEVDVTGTATDDVGVVGVTVNGGAATLDPPGGDDVTETAFSATISLEKGSNTIETIATDTSEKTGTDTRTVYNDSGPPTLDWTPADGASTSSDSIEVSGTVSDDVDVTGVTVNGSLVELVTTGNEGEYTFSTTVALEAGENMITVVATDGSGCADDTTEVHKVTLSTNTAPVVDAVNLPTDPVRVGNDVEAACLFTDPDSADTHTAILDWGDGSQSGASVDDRTATGSHAYLAAGRYLVGCEVTDAAGESDSGQSPLELIVFDPGAGFVTGGGWIRSPAGASAGDPLFSRKANFGINAKYKRGAMYPQGSIYFKADRMKFHSKALQWLIVSGEIAQIAGTGRINGEGPYHFLMTVSDGGRGRQLDGIRMKIWDESDPDNPIYDNQAGNADDSDATTTLGGGQVVIHR